MAPTIHVHPADSGGCGHYRMIWPAQALMDAGYDNVEWREPNSPGSDLIAHLTTGRDGLEHVVGVDHPGCDILVLQRPLQYQLLETIPHLQRHGVQVVVELDDDFENIHPRNIAWPLSHPNQSPTRNWRILKEACRLADRMVVSTPALRRYRPDAAVVPNFIPRWYTETPPVELDAPTLGWSGSIDTHPQDLQEVGNSVSRLIREGWEMKIVGTGKGVARAFGVSESTDMHNGLGWVDIETYPLEMQQMNVGLVPLQSIPFNQAKSWLKGLEWAALGVPFVASPTQQYLDLNSRYGIGTISLKSKHWYSHVKNVNLQEDGARARESVISNRLIIEERADMWYNAWVGKS